MRVRRGRYGLPPSLGFPPSFVPFPSVPPVPLPVQGMPHADGALGSSPWSSEAPIGKKPSPLWCLMLLEMLGSLGQPSL